MCSLPSEGSEIKVSVTYPKKEKEGLDVGMEATRENDNNDLINIQLAYTVLED